MSDVQYRLQDARYDDSDLKLLLTAFSDAPEGGSWRAILIDVSEPPAMIQRDQRAAMRLEDLLPIAQEMLDNHLRCYNKTSKSLEWRKRNV